MTIPKTHWKDWENLDYIGAYSLKDGQDKTVTIVEVKREMITGTGGKKEECTVATLKDEKPFILNRTNMKMIQNIYGTPYIEEWAGKSLTLYVAKIKAFGENNVECLRIRKVVPEKPELVPDNETWDNAVLALKSKSVTLSQILNKYKVSTINQQKLKDESDKNV